MADLKDSHRDFIAYRNAETLFGLQCLPKEIDAIADVLECTVIGLPHPDFGEAVTAILIPRPDTELTETSVADAMRRILARYKQPKRFLFAEAFPHNALGKIQKNVL